MTEEEFSILAKIIRTSYKREKVLDEPETLEIWFRLLSDIPYKTAETFLEKWLATEKWSPSIADIRAGCAEIVNGKPSDWGEGWADVMQAIRRYGYMHPKKAKESMSATAWQAVGYIGGWEYICASENMEMDRANFRKCYESISKREIEKHQLPPRVIDAIEGLKSNMALLPERKGIKNV